MNPSASPPPAPAARGPRPNGWLLAFSFLLMALCALPPLVLTSSLADRGWAGLLFEGTRKPFDEKKLNPVPGRIRMLDPFGPAARAGIRSGDRIVSLGGHALGDSAGLERQARTARPGDVMRFTIERDSARFARDVRLAGYWSGTDDRVLAFLYVLFAAAYFVIGYAVYVRRPDDPRAVIFHVLALAFAGSFVAASALSGPIFMRGLESGFPTDPVVLLSFALLFALGYGLMSLFLHFALVFPRRRPVLRAWPRLPLLLHGITPALFLAMAIPAAVVLLPGLRPTGARLAMLAFLLAALVPLGLALRGRRLLDRPLHGLLAFVLAWAALAVAARLLVPLAGMAAKIAGMALLFAPLAVLLLLPVACGIATLVCLAHSWNESDLEARQQIRWPLLAVVVNLVATVCTILLSLVAQQVLDASDSMIAQRVTEYAALGISLLIPLAFAVAIL